MQNSSPSPRIAPPFLFSALLLVTIATANINNFFGYHAPGAIAQSLQDTYHLSTSQFGLLFTLYSLPNIVLVFIGGVLIDKYGPAYTSLVFNFCMLAGMVVFALAPVDSPMLCFVIGRLLLGFGESLCASVATMLGLWFKGSVLTFSVGFNQAYVQLFGSAAAFYLLPLLPNARDALWVTAAVCLLSFLANVVYVLLEKGFPQYRPDYQPIAEVDDEYVGEVNGGSLVNGYHGAGGEQAGVDGEWRLQGHSHNVDDEYDATDDEVVHVHSDSLSPSPSGVFGSVASLPLLYWLIILMILLLSPILYTFTAFGPLEFQSKWHMTPAESGAATSVLYVTIIFSPLAGYVIDTFGYRTLIQAAAASLIPVWFVLLTYFDYSPVLGMTLLGLTFAVTESNGYAMIVEVVPQRQLGIAYGIAGCAVSLALLLEPAGVGLIYTYTGSFLVSNNIFIALSLAGWAVAVAICVYDVRHGSVMSGPKRREGEEEEEGGVGDEDGWGGADGGVIVATEGIGLQASIHRTGHPRPRGEDDNHIGYDDTDV